MPNSIPNLALRGDVKTQSAMALFSGLLALSIPLIVALYWPLYSISPDAAVVLLRPSIIGASFILTLLWYRAPATSAELQAACVLALLSSSLLIPCLTGTDPARSLGVWAKLLILCVMSLLLSRALRNDGTARAFGLALIVAGIVVGAFTVFTYVRFVGLALPTYKVARQFKGIAERTGIPLNAIPFTSVFSFMAGMSLVRPTWILYLLGSGLFIISSALTGSRTPLVVLAVSAGVLALLNALRSRRSPIRLMAYIVAIAIPVVIAFFLVHTPFKRMSALTEGRWDLWYVALEKFTTRPIFGYGYDSWHDDLASLLPGAYSLTHYMEKTIVGGYHNEYLALLAEQGLVGFLPAMIVVYFLLQACWKSAFRSWQTWHSGQWPLFACIFLLLRAGLEIPGLFGDGSEPADYLAYIFVAIVVSRFSVEEDFLRTNTALRNSTHEYAEPAISSRRAQGRHVPVGLDRSYV